MSDHVAKVVKNHPQRISFFITLLGNIVSIIVGIIFSTAVLRFSQEWARNNDHVTVFDVSLISAFRNQNWPWGIKDHRYRLVRKRWLPMVLAGACIATFAVVPSGTTSLIPPVSFNQTWPLTGTELDFFKSATDLVPECVAPLARLSVNCESPFWPTSDCHGDDQLVDLLEAGRSSVSRTFKIVHKL